MNVTQIENTSGSGVRLNCFSLPLLLGGRSVVIVAGDLSSIIAYLIRLENGWLKTNDTVLTCKLTGCSKYKYLETANWYILRGQNLAYRNLNLSKVLVPIRMSTLIPASPVYMHSITAACHQVAPSSRLAQPVHQIESSCIALGGM